MGKSVQRDIMLSRIVSKAGKDHHELMKYLSISPYKQHKAMAKKMLAEVQAVRADNDPTEA